MLTFINTPPTETRRPARVASTGPVPVLPPSQHAAAFAAFAGFGS